MKLGANSGYTFIKALFIMKLISIFLLAACLTAAANGNSQGITLSEKDADLPDVLKKIEMQSNFTFLYNQRLMKDVKKVSVNLKSVTIDEALQACFKDQPITYAIVGNT